MNLKYAKYLIEKSHSDYNAIADHFSNTRKHIWNDLVFLKEFIKSGDNILDFGCGNGRLISLLKDFSISYIGIDSSEKLIEIARNTFEIGKLKSVDFKVCDVLKTNFKNGSFDKIISIAVLHHIPSRILRDKFFKEAIRILKPGGILILSVWNLKQKRFLKYRIEFFLKKLFLFSKLNFNDIFYPWKDSKGKVLNMRYLHHFSKNELIYLAKKSGFKIEKVFFSEKNKKNLFLIARK